MITVRAGSCRAGSSSYMHGICMEGVNNSLRAAFLDLQSWGFGVTNLHLGIISLMDQLLYFLPAPLICVIGDCSSSPWKSERDRDRDRDDSSYVMLHQRNVKWFTWIHVMTCSISRCCASQYIWKLVGYWLTACGILLSYRNALSSAILAVCDNCTQKLVTRMSHPR